MGRQVFRIEIAEANGGWGTENISAPELGLKGLGFRAYLGFRV